MKWICVFQSLLLIFGSHSQMTLQLNSTTFWSLSAQWSLQFQSQFKSDFISLCPRAGRISPEVERGEQPASWPLPPPCLQAGSGTLPLPVSGVWLLLGEKHPLGGTSEPSVICGCLESIPGLARVWSALISAWSVVFPEFMYIVSLGCSSALPKLLGHIQSPQRGISMSPFESRQSILPAIYSPTLSPGRPSLELMSVWVTQQFFLYLSPLYSLTCTHRNC